MGIFDELMRSAADPDEIVGLFLHQQDAESLVEDPAHLSLPVTWDGSVNQRSQVGPLTWLRRLPA